MFSMFMHYFRINIYVAQTNGRMYLSQEGEKEEK